MKLFYIDRQPVGVFPIFIVPKQRSKFSLLREILSNATISSTTLLFHFTFRSQKKKMKPRVRARGCGTEKLRSTFRVVARPKNDRGEQNKNFFVEDWPVPS